MKKIGEIKDEFAAAGEADWQSMCDCYREDPRSGVQKLILQYEKKIKALEAEKLRMEQMMQYERKYEHLGYLCGIDEVGRGPLAGPVVACAVILPADHQILYLNDSKKLTAHKREELYDVILSEAVAVGIGMVGTTRTDAEEQDGEKERERFHAFVFDSRFSPRRTPHGSGGLSCENSKKKRVDGGFDRFCCSAAGSRREIAATKKEETVAVSSFG